MCRLTEVVMSTAAAMQAPHEVRLLFSRHSVGSTLAYANWSPEDLSFLGPRHVKKRGVTPLVNNIQYSVSCGAHN